MIRIAGSIVVLAAALCAPASADGQAVHIADTEGDVNFGTYIKAAFGKWKVPLTIVSDPDQADYRLLSSGSSRKGKWREGLLTQRGETASAAVEMIDRCGIVVWSEAAGDRSLRMDALVGPFAKRGPKKVADWIAKRLRTAPRKGQVPRPADFCPSDSAGS